jgi:BirA family biotin operon repressor/biotin-[acetyl-CoA-carboxylase] ligase
MTARFSAKALRESLTTSFVGRCLEYRAALGSTQDLGRELAEAGAVEGTVVLAGRQTAGRGRLGRSWISPRGGLYFTVVLRPPPEHLRALVIIAALAVARAMERLAGLQTSVKWPNDVLVAGRKVCGILSESELVGESVSYALVGIGVNVNADMAAYRETAALATSVMTELGREVSREALAAGILNEFEALYLAAQAGEPIHQEWRARLSTLGKEVRVRFGEQVEEGLAEDVDSDGSLVLRRADGSRVTIAAGDVTLRS